MKLGEARRMFSSLLVDLLHWAKEEGMFFALDEGMQHQEKGHKPGSLHYSGCAQDVLLYNKDGNYLDGKTFVTGSEEYRKLGEKWKSLHPLCRWGGDFKSSDGDHFSFSPPEIFGNLA